MVKVVNNMEKHYQKVVFITVVLQIINRNIHVNNRDEVVIHLKVENNLHYKKGNIEGVDKIIDRIGILSEDLFWFVDYFL